MRRKSGEDRRSAMTISEAAQRDLRRTCVHEYAHSVVARHFGAAGFVTIVSRCAGAAHYSGRFRMYGELADDEWRIVALAGAVAECVDEDPHAHAAAIVAALAADPDRLSAVDAQLAAGFAAADVERCVALVKALWREIASEADERTAAVWAAAHG